MAGVNRNLMAYLYMYTLQKQLF